MLAVIIDRPDVVPDTHRTILNCAVKHANIDNIYDKLLSYNFIRDNYTIADGKSDKYHFVFLFPNLKQMKKKAVTIYEVN